MCPQGTLGGDPGGAEDARGESGALEGAQGIGGRHVRETAKRRRWVAAPKGGRMDVTARRSFGCGGGTKDLR